MPKFNEDKNSKEWWRFTRTFNENPDNRSALEMKETNKFWAKNDEIKLADVREELPPQDPFKTEHNKKLVKDEVAMKVHTINHWHSNDTEAKVTEFKVGH